MGTIAEQLIDRGVQQGRAEGHIEGQRRTLLRLLEAKFGDLPKNTLLRVEAATSEELEDLALHVLSAQTLEDVFRPS